MKKQHIRKLAFGAFALATLTWIVWPNLADYAFPAIRTLDVEKRGQFGDSFGSLNALFTGLGFIGVALTFYLQLVDRREREAQHAEEKREQYAAEFEARFFRLNDSLREVVGAMIVTRYNDDNPITEKMGKDVFARYVADVGLARLDITLHDSEMPTLEKALHQYAYVFGAKMDDLAPYFRMLYRLMRYIDGAKVQPATKTEFAEIVRAELSPSELRLLALNCLTDYGAKFKCLVERYHLLKHLPEDEHRLNKELFRASFNPSAFYDADDPRPPSIATVPPLASTT